MKRDFLKDCADSLRAFASQKYGVKLKPAHAHELVAAYFGYPSRNALLADKKLPIADLPKSDFVIMMPDEFIRQRREKLQGLSSDLPDSYTLGEAVYKPLFAEEILSSRFPPFRSFEELAKYVIDNSHEWQAALRFARIAPMHHYVTVETEEQYELLTVIHGHHGSTGEVIGAGKTTIKLPRVAGRVGFGQVETSVETWSGGARRVIANAAQVP